MKHIIWFFLVGRATAQMVVNPFVFGVGGPPPISYTINETFEGTGAPSGDWVTSGTINFDYTTTPIEGAQSLATLGATNGADCYAQVYFAVPAAGVTEIYARIRVLDLPSGTQPILRFLNNATVRCTAFVNASGQISIQTTGGTTGSTVTGVVVGDVWHVWFYHKGGTGVTGEASVAISSDGTRPTSGNGYGASTGGTAATAPDRARLNGEWSSTVAGSVDLLWDTVKVAKDQTIPSNP